MYVYIRSEPRLWTVGYYDPSGKFEPESDHDTPEKAAKRVRYLNGGRDEPSGQDIRAAIDFGRTVDQHLR